MPSMSGRKASRLRTKAAAQAVTAAASNTRTPVTSKAAPGEGIDPVRTARNALVTMFKLPRLLGVLLFAKWLWLILKEFDVAAVCDGCAKGPGFGKSVSHSHRRTNRRWNPKIQTVHANRGRPQ